MKKKKYKAFTRFLSSTFYQNRYFITICFRSFMAILASPALHVEPKKNSNISKLTQAVNDPNKVRTTQKIKFENHSLDKKKCKSKIQKIKKWNPWFNKLNLKNLKENYGYTFVRKYQNQKYSNIYVYIFPAVIKKIPQTAKKYNNPSPIALITTYSSKYSNT